MAAGDYWVDAGNAYLVDESGAYLVDDGEGTCCCDGCDGDCIKVYPCPLDPSVFELFCIDKNTEPPLPFKASCINGLCYVYFGDTEVCPPDARRVTYTQTETTNCYSCQSVCGSGCQCWLVTRCGTMVERVLCEKVDQPLAVGLLVRLAGVCYEVQGKVAGPCLFVDYQGPFPLSCSDCENCYEPSCCFFTGDTATITLSGFSTDLCDTNTCELFNGVHILGAANKDAPCSWGKGIGSIGNICGGPRSGAGISLGMITIGDVCAREYSWKVGVSHRPEFRTCDFGFSAVFQSTFTPWCTGTFDLPLISSFCDWEGNYCTVDVANAKCTVTISDANPNAN